MNKRSYKLSLVIRGNRGSTKKYVYYCKTKGEANSLLRYQMVSNWVEDYRIGKNTDTATFVCHRCQLRKDRSCFRLLLICDSCNKKERDLKKWQQENFYSEN